MKVEFEHLGKPVTLSGFDGDHITRVIDRTGTFYESEMLDFMAGLNVEGTAVDVGANIGNHTVYLGLFTMLDKVIAIEPYTPAAELLHENVEANNLGNKVIQLTSALGSTRTMVGLKPGKRGNRGHTKVVRGTEVEQTTLDEVADGEHISVIKIDVEGYELEVLAGAVETLATHNPYLFVEAKRLRHKRRIDEFLSAFGYKSRCAFNRTPTFAYMTHAQARKIAQVVQHTDSD